jgi:hypothetical protein
MPTTTWSAHLPGWDLDLRRRCGMGQPDENALEGPLKDLAQFLTVLDENLSDKSGWRVN